MQNNISNAVGVSNKKDKKFSREEFLEDHLKKAFEKATKEKKKVWIDFDGTWRYSSSCILYTFGRLSDEFGKNIINHLEIKSEEEGMLIDKIREVINEGNS